MAETAKAPRSQINIRVPDNFNEKAKLAAALAGCTPSEFMRRAIVRALSDVLGDKGAALSPPER